MTIGEAVKQFLNEQGMSVAEAADYLNITFHTLKKIIGEKTNPSRRTIQRMAAIEPRFKSYIEPYCCLHCGKQYTDGGVQHANFCSAECRTLYRRERQQKQPKPVLVIDQEKYPVAYIINQIITSKDITISEMAKVVGISRAAIKRILDGEQSASTTIYKINEHYPGYGLDQHIERIKCVICGKEFIPKSCSNNTCSESCHDKRKLEMMAISKEAREAALSAGTRLPTEKKRKYRNEPPERSIKIVNETGRQSGMSYGYQSAYEHLGWA